MPAATSLPSEPSRSSTATLAPRAANSSALARPIPDAPPMTTTFLPLISIQTSVFDRRSDYPALAVWPGSSSSRCALCIVTGLPCTLSRPCVTLSARRVKVGCAADRRGDGLGRGGRLRFAAGQDRADRRPARPGQTRSPTGRDHRVVAFRGAAATPDRCWLGGFAVDTARRDTA